MSNARWTLLLLMLLVTGCGGGSATSGSFCTIASPIYVSSRDVLTDGTVVEILKHNETWERLCR